MIELNDTAATQPASDRATALLGLIRPLLVEQSFSPAVNEFLSKLTQLLGCERASLGFVDGRTIKVCAVSRHFETADLATQMEVAAAMEESVLQDALLTYPRPSSDFPYIVVAHAELARRNHLSGVLTVPLARAGELIGAITIEHCKADTFVDDQVWTMEKIATDVGPLLHFKWMLEQPRWKRLVASLRQNGNHDAGRMRRQARLIIGTFAAVSATVLFAFPFQNEIAGPARLEASVQRVMTVPFDGYLKEVHVRPGNRVQTGQVLAVLDEESMLTQRRRLEAEVLQHENALAEAMVKADRAQVAIRSAKLDEVVAQKDLLDTHLEQTQLLAPFDGVVIKGDLTQLLGSPLKRSDTLLTLSQGDGFRVVVDVGERDISEIRIGQEGTLVLAALPGERFRVRVARITPVASVTADGQNVFEVEAAVDAGNIALAPGMKGVAKIGTDVRPVGWKWVTRAWHALVYMVWSRLG